jgi:serine/threonine-protein kinase
MTAVEIPTPDPRTFDELSRPFAEAVAARYAVKRLIGRGGMGIVYLARDRRLDRLVAIKTLPPALAADAIVRERFLRETRMAGSLSHPNIVPVHGSDETDGHVFFVMGYVDGESLSSHVMAQGRLEPGTVVHHLRDVASALAHAHSRGVIHRDIKAENILIDRATGRALVTDFGIARLAEAAPLTATGQLLGTVYYVSPEQVSGGAVDARSDLYSLGVVGFLALTGTFPFDADVASAVLVAHVTRPAPPVRSLQPGVPAALAAVIDRCLAKDPADRFASADALLKALESATVDDTKSSATRRKHLISDDEARAVWQRAADLQASTGIRPRPAPVARARDLALDEARTSGFSSTEVRDAALQAGIGSAYVEHAMAERGLANVSSRTVSPRPRSSRWAGVPLDITIEQEVAGEVQARHFDRLINVVREGTTSLGTIEDRGQALRWSGAWFGHRLQVAIVPVDGRTEVRFSQSLRRAALSALMASVATGGVVGATLGICLDLLMRLPGPRWMPTLTSDATHAIASAVGAVAAVVCLRFGRGMIRSIRDYNAARLQTLAELLGLKVRDAIADEAVPAPRRSERER